MREFDSESPEVIWSLNHPSNGLLYAGRRMIQREFGLKRAEAERAAQAARKVAEEGGAPLVAQAESTAQKELIGRYCNIVRENLPEKSEPMDHFVEALVALQEDIQSRSREQNLVQITIKTKKPILKVVRADWHLGNVNTNHRRFLEDNELIEARPYVKTIEGGDFIEGAVLSNMLDLLHEQIAPVKLQRMLLWDVVESQVNHILALIKGQHDSWTTKTADFDPIEWLADNTKLPYLGWGGKIELTVGEQKWNIIARHSYKYNSAFNDTHSNLQLFRMGEHGVGDISIICDRHVPTYHEFLMAGQMRVAMRPGSYKPTDSFQQKNSFNSSLPLMPGVILWPDRRCFIGSSNFRNLIPIIDRMQEDDKLWRDAEE